MKDSSAVTTLRRRSLWASAPLILAALGLLAAPVSAATVAVNTTADLNTGSCSSTCSLRDAVATANPGDTVQVPAGHYVLTLGEIAFSKSLTVAGAGARTTILDGNGAGRIFNEVNAALTDTFEIDDVALVNGLAVTNSTFFAAPDGGAIAGTGHLMLLRCLVANNQAEEGGGIAWHGDLDVALSTITGNRATSGAGKGGGGIFANDSGADTPSAIVDSTLTGNSAPMGGAATLGGMFLINDTVSGNQAGGGLAFVAAALANTIVAGNQGGDCVNLGLVVVTDHNIDGDNSCGFTDAGSKPGVDPLLGPLANNGGPTDTLALLAGSPAIDAGDNAICPPTDQRGVTRPQGPACDIGAYEGETPLNQIAALIAQINALVTAGSLAQNNANPLITKLNQVVAKLDAGQTTAACGQFGAFINQLNADIGNGTLTPAAGQPLLGAANAIKASLGC